MLGRRNKATIKSRVCRCPCADSPHRLPIAALVVGVAKTHRQHAQPRSREVRIAKKPKAASQHKRLRDFLPYVHAGDKGVENPCLVGIGACATSRHWSRALQALGHTVRLMPAAYVKPYLKCQRTMPSMPKRSAKRWFGQTCDNHSMTPARSATLRFWFIIGSPSIDILAQRPRVPSHRGRRTSDAAWAAEPRRDRRHSLQNVDTPSSL